MADENQATVATDAPTPPPAPAAAVVDEREDVTEADILPLLEGQPVSIDSQALDSLGGRQRSFRQEFPTQPTEQPVGPLCQPIDVVVRQSVALLEGQKRRTFLIGVLTA